MNTAVETEASRKDARWIPWLFVIFFGVLTVLLGSFAYIAISTDRGVVTEDAYKKGLRYNDVLEKQQAQDALGWQGDLALSGQGQKQDFTFTLQDKNHRPVANGDVRMALVRPTQAGHDMTVALKAAAPGVYTGQATLPLPGLWEAHVVVHAGDKDYQYSKRLSVP